MLGIPRTTEKYPVRSRGLLLHDQTWDETQKKQESSPFRHLSTIQKAIELKRSYSTLTVTSPPMRFLYELRVVRLPLASRGGLG